MTLRNIYNIPTGALSDVLKDAAKFLPCSHVICYLAQDLTAWGFALCPQFHMIKCVSVHKYANVSSSFSHLIWKCQFWWWRALISPRLPVKILENVISEWIAPQDLFSLNARVTGVSVFPVLIEKCSDSRVGKMYVQRIKNVCQEFVKLHAGFNPILLF